MSDPEFFYTASSRKCGKCAHWGMCTATSLTGVHYVEGPRNIVMDGVIVQTCGLDQRPGVVVNGVGWSRGSDHCSLWKREQ